MLEDRLEHLVENTVVSLPEAHTGLVLVVLVGFSFSLSHVFSLLANRLKPRQILVHVLLDSLVLAAARARRATSRAVASASVRAASSSAATRFSRMMSDRVSILIELVRLSARGRGGAR